MKCSVCNQHPAVVSCLLCESLLCTYCVLDHLLEAPNPHPRPAPGHHTR